MWVCDCLTGVAVSFPSLPFPSLPSRPRHAADPISGRNVVGEGTLTLHRGSELRLKSSTPKVRQLRALLALQGYNRIALR